MRSIDDDGWNDSQWIDSRLEGRGKVKLRKCFKFRPWDLVSELDSDDLSDEYRTFVHRYIDLTLVDTNGTIDILEIKKPFNNCLLSKTRYRDHYILETELSGLMMRLPVIRACDQVVGRNAFKRRSAAGAVLASLWASAFKRTPRGWVER